MFCPWACLGYLCLHCLGADLGWFKLLFRLIFLVLGPQWRQHRKIANPSYSKKSVQHYASVFHKEADRLAKVLCRKDPNLAINVYEDVVKTTTQCVCRKYLNVQFCRWIFARLKLAVMMRIGILVPK